MHVYTAKNTNESKFHTFFIALILNFADFYNLSEGF